MLYLIDIKDVNTGNACIRVAYSKDISARDISTKSTYAKVNYFEGTCTGCTYTRDIYVKSICSGNIYISGISISNTYTCDSIENLIFWNSCIFSVANNPYKFALLDLKLLANSKLGMLVSFCLCL